tara:strand:+ start:114 stop:491 length:378 start_codon:yes stop_codon:yes gene_type:complete
MSANIEKKERASHPLAIYKCSPYYSLGPRFKARNAFTLWRHKSSETISHSNMSFKDKLEYINSLESRDERIKFMKKEENRQPSIEDLNIDIEEWSIFGKKLEYLNSLKTSEERIKFMKEDMKRTI